MAYNSLLAWAPVLHKETDLRTQALTIGIFKKTPIFLGHKSKAPWISDEAFDNGESPNILVFP